MEEMDGVYVEPYTNVNVQIILFIVLRQNLDSSITNISLILNATMEIQSFIEDPIEDHDARLEVLGMPYVISIANVIVAQIAEVRDYKIYISVDVYYVIVIIVF